MNLQKQIELLKKYNIKNYIIENEKIIINGSLDLRSLTVVDKKILNNNVNKLTEGYNKEKEYCYFDGILSKVINVIIKKDYTIFTVNNGFIVKKDNFTAHGKTVKQAIQDVEFKIVQDKLKNEPVYKDTLITVNRYKLLTGACDMGCRDFMMKNNIPYKIVNNLTVEENPMTASELLQLLKINNSYGVNKFESLIL